MRVLIKNGTVLTDVDEYKADVLIEDEKIAAIGFNLDETADQIIDGRFVQSILKRLQYSYWDHIL